MSVHLSVCHTPVLYQNEESYRVLISSPSESVKILVSGNIRLIPKFERGHPCEDNVWDWGGYELAIFRPISHRTCICISETVQDKTKSLRFYSSLLGRSHIRAFDWHPNQRPWMTTWIHLERPLRFLNPSTGSWGQIDPRPYKLFDIEKLFKLIQTRFRDF